MSPSGPVGTRIEVTLHELREVRHRIDHKQLEASDWPLLGALVSKQIARAEDRQERMAAKVAAAAAAAEKDTEEPVPNTNASSDATDSASSPDTSTPSPGEPESAATPSGDANRRKGHGRNGASAYRSAEHFHYTLPSGVIGALCDACKQGNMTHYRDKTIVRIKGQPLFAAEQHHYEQGRCRNCGRIVRAEGPVYVQAGFGTDCIRYDGSACAFLIVMHYSSSSPFKRLDSLHDGWGVPMSDANQWELVDQGDDALLPLYRAIENHAIQKSTNFRIDDTQSVVISLKKQIDAEIAALRAVGESTKDVRTGINATGSYWETPEGPVVLYCTGRHHAGEIVDHVMRRHLLSSPKLAKCTDGASKNFDHEHADTLIEVTCNAHAFLKFRDIRDKYPAEYAEAGQVYDLVFHNNDKPKALGLNPIERMLYHRQHSKPAMLKLKAMCE
jgi:transposase